jgi:hypothetical protein
LIPHVPDRDGALAAIRAAVNDADKCGSVTAAENFYFAALGRLAHQQRLDHAFFEKAGACQPVEATQRIGIPKNSNRRRAKASGSLTFAAMQ